MRKNRKNTVLVIVNKQIIVFMHHLLLICNSKKHSPCLYD